jgi:N-acetylglutamate synthase-like GNAT family acetyltransferase
MHLRHAAADDADTLASLVNAAYRVEDCFKIGDRIDAACVRDEMARGTFLVLEDDHGLAGCVYVEVTGELGYFGLLSVDPVRQGQGHDSTLLRAAEEFCRGAGCRVMEILVVNLRTELFTYYRRHGHVERGIRPLHRRRAHLPPLPLRRHAQGPDAAR